MGGERGANMGASRAWPGAVPTEEESKEKSVRRGNECQMPGRQSTAAGGSMRALWVARKWEIVMQNAMKTHGAKVARRSAGVRLSRRLRNLSSLLVIGQVTSAGIGGV